MLFGGSALHEWIYAAVALLYTDLRIDLVNVLFLGSALFTAIGVHINEHICCSSTDIY